MKLSFAQKLFLPLVAMPSIEPATNGDNVGHFDAPGDVHLFQKFVTFVERDRSGLASRFFLRANVNMGLIREEARRC